MLVPLQELSSFARDFVEHLPTTRGARAHIVGLKGDLGAGKTAFVQEVARALGVPGLVVSPTFVIAKVYPIGRPPFERLVHIDAYRLHPGMRDSIGWKGYSEDPANLIFVEWPERLPGGAPEGIDTILFSYAADNSRDIVFTKGSI